MTSHCRALMRRTIAAAAIFATLPVLAQVPPGPVAPMNAAPVVSSVGQSLQAAMGAAQPAAQSGQYAQAVPQSTQTSGYQNLPQSAPLSMPPAIPVRPGAGLPPEIFGQAYNAQIPLSSDQIRDLKKLLDESKKASSESATKAPNPESSRISLSLAPGRPPIPIRLSAGIVSTILFTDSTGAPWPIVGIVPGEKGKFDIQHDDKKAPHIFTIVPMEAYASSNLSIWLENSTMPVVVSVVAGQRSVDFMLELSIQARGPNAKAASIDFSLSSDVIPPEQNAILNGLTPQGATELKVSGGDAKAWLIGGKLLLRTQMILRAPTARRVFSGADGTKVYELPSTPIINMISDGKNVVLTVSGFPAPYMAQATK